MPTPTKTFADSIARLENDLRHSQVIVRYRGEGGRLTGFNASPTLCCGKGAELVLQPFIVVEECDCSGHEFRASITIPLAEVIDIEVNDEREDPTSDPDDPSFCFRPVARWLVDCWSILRRFSLDGKP